MNPDVSTGTTENALRRRAPGPLCNACSGELLTSGKLCAACVASRCFRTLLREDIIGPVGAACGASSVHMTIHTKPVVLSQLFPECAAANTVAPAKTLGESLEVLGRLNRTKPELAGKIAYGIAAC